MAASSSSDILLRDWQHAARLFTDNQFRLAPKFKFLFHVAFGINQAALININLIQRHRNEINMLVKSCDLPSFKIANETLFQYNRKKNIQYTHTYNPINIIFHDDNMGLINHLWQNYYNYYYADPSSAEYPGAYSRNATKNFSYFKTTYGLDNGSKLPFFKYIKIYQMAKHEYVQYTLHNPIITGWNHNKVGYSDNGTHDNNMEITYEAVSYDTGNVSQGSPEGFGQEHYDQTPSPLPPAGSKLNSPSFTEQPVVSNAVNTVSTTINSYQNTSVLPVSGVAGLSSIKNLNSPAQSPTSGISNVVFPVSSLPTINTIATLVKL